MGDCRGCRIRYRTQDTNDETKRCRVPRASIARAAARWSGSWLWRSVVGLSVSVVKRRVVHKMARTARSTLHKSENTVRPRTCGACMHRLAIIFAIIFARGRAGGADGPRFFPPLPVILRKDSGSIHYSASNHCDPRLRDGREIGFLSTMGAGDSGANNLQPPTPHDRCASCFGELDPQRDDDMYLARSISSQRTIGEK